MAQKHTTTVVIGAGHSGLAMSYRLRERGIDHVVLERGQIADSWRHGRWDSLRLLTPNWQAELPGARYSGTDPDGYLTMPEVVDHIVDYARIASAPVVSSTAVERVSAIDGGYRVQTDAGEWHAKTVVAATGACTLPNIPALADGVPAGVRQLSPLDYRSPAMLDDGGVLVVGASASGVQLAEEIALSGRRVVISTGEHVRMPRTYRGHDIFWWMHHAGVLDERYDEVDDIVRARHVPSPQLIGSPERRELHLGTLQDHGVEVVGRLGMIRDGVALFSGGLANVTRLADLKQERLLDRFDEWALQSGRADGIPPHRPEPVTVPAQPRLKLDLVAEGISTIIWATGFTADYSWLDVPVVDRKGRVVHDGGVTEAKGLYVLGTSLLRRRRSTYINGAAQDSDDLAAHLDATLAGDSRAARVPA
ncbi:NAD(P)-binding domain-containing protein [Humibacter albus]|uniref:NAD(P)-binding domain-containing protein n=1 Tax=Humibacter albus TaxID=427754 RepID=UPI0003B516F0|nr:NAD(P)-binding domain-containing protein [Humibacter albus]